MATIALEPCRFYKGGDGKAPEYEGMTVVGTEIAGDLIVKTNNAAVVISDSATVITHLIDSSGANTMPGDTLYMPLLILRPSDYFVMNVWHTTAASAVVADSLLDAQGNYPVVKKTVSGSTAWTIDIANIGVSASVRLIGRLDSATDLYPRCIVQFLNTVTQAM